MTGWAREPGGGWHVLADLDAGVETPALCGETGPWVSVTTLAPDTGLIAACPDCARLAVDVRGPDTWSSASRQHYIDTGAYLPA